MYFCLSQLIGTAFASGGPQAGLCSLGAGPGLSSAGSTPTLTHWLTLSLGSFTIFIPFLTWSSVLWLDLLVSSLGSASLGLCTPGTSSRSRASSSDLTPKQCQEGVLPHFLPRLQILLEFIPRTCGHSFPVSMCPCLQPWSLRVPHLTFPLRRHLWGRAWVLAPTCFLASLSRFMLGEQGAS